ncbi:MAG: LysM domain-containing protein [Chloroflexota bacterium]
MKLLFPVFASIALVISQGLIRLQNNATPSVTPSVTGAQIIPVDIPVISSTSKSVTDAAPFTPTEIVSNAALPVNVQQQPAYFFGNPAGCASVGSPELTADQMLANVQSVLGNTYKLAERRQLYVWNGPLGSYMDVSQDSYVYEFAFNEFQHPLTYRADQVVTTFLNNGFVVWLRAYGGNFRLTAVPMVNGVLNSAWGDYVTSYWQTNGKPNDKYIYPVMKKLPCHWVIDSGYVSNETLQHMFNLDWHIPNYLGAGRQYLANNCKEANRISQEKIGYWDASSMCGPLAWTIMRDVNGFPYRIGSWIKDAGAFTSANPRSNGQPWGTFDPDTFTLMHTDASMPGYDFEKLGNLYPGDLIYSYATPYVTPGYFDHIFLVAGIDGNNTRLSISNMVRNSPHADCSIEEIQLYTPGDREHGVINHEWNGVGFGRTGTTGFDVFRWNWITYHINSKPIQYKVRWGDTLETIAFDWKVSPENLAGINQLAIDVQLTPGQIITLPATSA